MSKMKMTVEQAMKHPYVAAIYVDPLIAAARELSDSVSMRVLRASETLSATDMDIEHEWDRATDEFYESRRVFVDVHAKTEVTL